MKAYSLPRRAKAVPNILAGLIALPTLALAQAPATTPATQMPVVTVTASQDRDENNVLPTYRPVEGLFGFDQSVLEAPRSVTIVTKRQLEDGNIRTFEQLPTVASGTFSAAQFGIQALPQIRGVDAELFQNGIRRVGGNNGYGVPFSFNPVESLDVVKGPPPPMLGATQRVGGYVNIDTKKPYFDAYHGDLGASFGSFDAYRWHVDLGGPILPNDKLAFRFSYEGEHDGSFYDNIRYETEDFYFALASKLSEDVRIDFNVEYFNAPHYGDNAGINRPTQALIDHGIYIQGPANFVGFGSVVSPTGTTHIPRSQVNTAQGDGSSANVWIVQNNVNWKVNEHLTVENDTYFQYLHKETYNANSFVEIIDGSYVVEDRLALKIGFDYPFLASPATPLTAPSGKDAKDDKKALKAIVPASTYNNEIITGFDFRWNHVVGFSNFNFEADNPLDLTAPVSSRVFPRTSITGSQDAGGKFRHALVSSGGDYPLGKDSFGNVGIGGNGDSQDSNIYQYGYFLQQNTHLADKLSLLIGGRADLLAVNVTDPIPPAGFAPANDSTLQLMGSGNASLSYKVAPWVTPYATYSYSQSYNSALGNGVALSGNILPNANFHIVSDLYETGLKFSFLDSKLTFTAAAFLQDRNARAAFTGTNIKYRVKGVELDAAYQPNKNFYATANMSLVDEHLRDTGGVLQATGTVNDAFDNSRPDIIHGTSQGSPNFPAFNPANYRISGVPKLVIGGELAYTSDSGFGASLNGIVTSSYPLDLAQTVTIPWQYTVNAAVYYRKANYEVRFDVYNLTDAKNWSPSFGFFGGGFFGADDVYPELPRRFEGSVRYKF